MKAKVFLICLHSFVLFFSPPTLAQLYQFELRPIIVLQGYGIKNLNAHGTSGISNHVSNLSYINPAALNAFNNYSLGISYQFSTPIDDAFLLDIGSSRENSFFPQSAGGLIKVCGFSIGLGLGQRFNGNLDFDPIPITTFQNPDGTGEFYTPEYKTTVRNYSVAVSYSLKEILDWKNDLMLGFRYNHNQLRYIENSPIFNIDERLSSGNWAAGAIYKLNFSDNRNFQVGISYEQSSEFNKLINVNYTSISRDTFYLFEIVYYKMKDRIPAELKLDFYTNLVRKFQFMSSFTNVYWNSVSSGYRNQFEFSGSVVYKINDMFLPSVGFYSTGRNFVEDFVDMNDKMQAFFFTLGLDFNYSILNANLALAHSSLFSGDLRKETIGKFAIGIKL